MFFDDGVRRIDYILAWEVPEKKEEEDRNQAKAKKARETFEENLIKEGLELEHDLVRACCFCYRKICVKWPLKDETKILMTNGSLMKV